MIDRGHGHEHGMCVCFGSRFDGPNVRHATSLLLCTFSALVGQPC
jgi:hypothetical protein